MREHFPSWKQDWKTCQTNFGECRQISKHCSFLCFFSLAPFEQLAHPNYQHGQACSKRPSAHSKRIVLLKRTAPSHVPQVSLKELQLTTSQPPKCPVAWGHPPSVINHGWEIPQRNAGFLSFYRGESMQIIYVEFSIAIFDKRVLNGFSVACSSQWDHLGARHSMRSNPRISRSKSLRIHSEDESQGRNWPEHSETRFVCALMIFDVSAIPNICNIQQFVYKII